MRSLPTLPAADAHDTTPPAGCGELAALTLSRRGFVSTAAWSALAAALASACGGGEGLSGVKGPSASGVTFSNGVVWIPLTSVTALAQPGGFLITNGGDNDVRDATSGRRPDVIVINVGPDQFRAFTSICTHEQCTVGDFTGSRIRCFCHGSEFDSNGRVAAGPATRALTEYTVKLDAATRTLTVMRG
ncbi:Rieske (2Fe-2S) protein [Gemmatirosa kalamazoonensis]|nr:Rieske (2Fe-2S) protein [Gemmatirosa kalamazoonensis]